MTFAVVGVAAVAGTWWWLDRAFDDIPTFDQTPPRPPEGAAPSTTLVLPAPPAQQLRTFLVFGVGSQGVDGEEGSRTRIGADRLAHTDGLTDAIMLVVADLTNGRAVVVSLPRDTWLEHRRSRINAVYVTGGAQAFADEVTALTGIPVHHMVAVNFAAVVDVVDTLGGVRVRVPVEMRDRNSGLSLQEGCVHLDGADALALVRSRHLEYRDGGRWRTDPSGDFGRIERTQQLLAATLSQVSLVSLPTQVPALLDAAADNVVRDAGLGLPEALSVARAFAGGVEVRFWQPPADPARRGAASVVVWRPEASEVLDRLAAAVASGSLTGTELDPAPAAPGGAAPPEAPAGDPTPASGVAAPPATTPEVQVPTGVSKVPPITAGC